MPDPTPAAVPAAPAAAPAPAASAAPAAPATSAAPAAAPPVPAAPAAAAAIPAPVADDPGDSLIPADPAPPPPAALTPEQQLEAAKKLIADHEAAADPNGRNPDGSKTAWLLSEGVMGQGEKPSWFKTDKYKTVAAQAEAYTALESRFGGFVGAPKDGKYAFTPPEGVEVAMDHPLMQEFTKWASAKQLSQEGYSELLGMLVQYEAAHQPNMADIKTRLGDNADTRINQASAWVKANLGAEGFSNFRAATTGANADAVFKLVEGLIGKSGQVRMPKPGEDVPGGAPGAGLEAIKAAHGARMPDGKLRVDVEPAYRADIEKRYRDYYAGQAA